MELSARNQLQVTVSEVHLGDVMAEVILRLGDGQELVAAITRRSAEALELRPGATVLAVVKATEVMIGRP